LDKYSSTRNFNEICATKVIVFGINQPDTVHPARDNRNDAIQAIRNRHLLQGTSAQWPGSLEAIQIRNVIERWYGLH